VQPRPVYVEYRDGGRGWDRHDRRDRYDRHDRWDRDDRRGYGR
jgi:hypothetical protein